MFIIDFPAVVISHRLSTLSEFIFTVWNHKFTGNIGEQVDKVSKYLLVRSHVDRRPTINPWPLIDMKRTGRSE